MIHRQDTVRLTDSRQAPASRFRRGWAVVVGTLVVAGVGTACDNDGGFGPGTLRVGPLVPGEEADNASIAYVQVGRPMAVNLDGAIRVGWTRAETDIGNAYYQRFGLSVRMNYRPNNR